MKYVLDDEFEGLRADVRNRLIDRVNMHLRRMISRYKVSMKGGGKAPETAEIMASLISALDLAEDFKEPPEEKAKI